MPPISTPHLFWLGVRALTGPGDTADASGAETFPAASVLGRGFLINLLNPKIVIFYAAFLPQFVTPADGSMVSQFLLLGTLFTVLGFVMDSRIAVASGRARETFLRGARASRLLERLSGVVFVGLGVRPLFEGRPA